MTDTRHGYPLTVVFLLLAVVAVLSMLVTSGQRRHTTDIRHKPPERWAWPANQAAHVPPPDGVTYVDGDLVATVTFSAGALSGIGAAIFGWIRRRWSGLLLGIPTGTVSGTAFGLLLMMPPSPGSLLAACGVFVAIAAGLRLLGKNEPTEVDVRDELAEFQDGVGGAGPFG